MSKSKLLQRFALCIVLGIAVCTFVLRFLFAIEIGWAVYIGFLCSAFLLFGYDKAAAKNNRVRVPESFVLLVAALGASPAIVLAMLVFRHKIRDRTLLPILTVLILAQILVLHFLLPQAYTQNSLSQAWVGDRSQNCFGIITTNNVRSVHA